MENEIVKRDTVEEIVMRYNSAMDQAQKALEALALAQQMAGCDLVRYRDYFNVADPADSMKQIRKHTKQATWRRIIAQLGVMDFSSAKKCNEMDKLLNDEHQADKLPEIETEAILDLLEGLRQNAPNMLQETVDEAFDILRPACNSTSDRWGPGRYKTNQEHGRYDLGEKIILSGYIEHGWSRERPHRVNHYREDQLRQIEKVFFMLDGQPLPHRPNDIVTQINEGILETPYFSMKAFPGATTLHVKFKRMDLVRDLNARAGNKTLKATA
jgi:hypothetical protein